LSTGRYLPDSQSCQSSGVVVVRHILEQLDREIEKLHEEAALAA
jgi:hypothetical protein